MIYHYNILANKFSEAHINPSWKVVTAAKDDDKINCIHCGKPMLFKDSCESSRYKNEHNQFYRECVVCAENFKNMSILSNK